MTGHTQPNNFSHEPDDLAELMQHIKDVIAQDDFQTAASLVEANIAAVWFGIPPSEMVEILQNLLNHLDSPTPLLQASYRILSATLTGESSSRELLATIDSDDPQQMFVLAMFRINELRQQGRAREAFQQTEHLEQLLGKMRFVLDPSGGWRLQSAIEIGVSAMLAGDFTKALAAFTQVQLHATVPKYAYLTRDSLVKSALIHACFGNGTTAKAYLERTAHIAPTSSWIESQLGAQQEFVKVLTYTDDHYEAANRLESVSLQNVGEMWPFYVVALHRTLEAVGHYEKLNDRLEFLDSLPFPRIDRDGFSGSVIPLKRAMLALQVGHGSEAQVLLRRADPHLAYTRLILAAAELYAGRHEQALQQALSLRRQTRGFRLMEIRRLSIVSTAQYQLGHTGEATSTLKHAAGLPHGLGPTEVQLFNPMLRQFAEQRVEGWPITSKSSKSTFLTGMPQTAVTLTPRETEILKHLVQRRTRAQIAQKLFISPNTVKTQLRSIFRKPGVSSASGAVREGRGRGIL